EKLLQLFKKEAYASAFLDCNKHIDYKHLCKPCSLPLSSVLMAAKSLIQHAANINLLVF
ncbi:hypothetical protein Tco_0061136, partial [Tanacetum coccineum]